MSHTSESRFEQTAVPERLPDHGRGRTARGWSGGKRVIEAAMGLAAGRALRFTVPQEVPVDRARWGIYRAASLRGVKVSIARQGRELTVWRLNQSRVES